MKKTLPYILFEAVLNTNGSTQGLSEFIQEINNSFPNNIELLKDLSSFISSSGCPKIRFDTLYGAMGISKTDECIIDKDTLTRSLGDLLYVILHEIAHQYQYKKYGKDVVWDAYSSNIDIDQAGELLMNIELVADRLAYLKAKSLLKSHNIEEKTPISTFYSNMDKKYFTNYLKKLRDEVKSKNLSSIEEVNEYIYNKLKTKPILPQKQPRIFQNQSKIDKILDKLSARGWSNLTDGEKNTLRAASKK
jgi:hypothetical protein